MTVKARHFGQIAADVGARVTLHKVRLRPHAVTCFFEIPLVANKILPDVILNQNFATLFGTKAVVFIHDLMFETSPKWFTFLERRYFGLMSKFIWRASKVLTSSSTEASRISTLHPGSNPVAVGLGISSDLVSVQPNRPKDAPESFTFMLTVGRLNVRKNLAYVVQIADKSGLLNSQNPLVIVGAPGGLLDSGGAIEGYVDSGSVRYTGTVDTQDLAWYYSNCSAFIFLSKDEGFGLPPVEAQFFGAPTFVSDIPVMREVTAGHATYLPLDNLERASELLAGAKIRKNATDQIPDLLHLQHWTDVVSRIRSNVVGTVCKDTRSR